MQDLACEAAGARGAEFSALPVAKEASKNVRASQSPQNIITDIGRTEMKRFAATVMSLSLLAWASSHGDAPSAASSESAQAIKVTRSGSQPSRQGPPENFTGTVRIEPLFNANPPSRTSGGRVTFDPGARTAWHTHPLGQTLIVTSGSGWVQPWGGQIEEIGQGDVVWIPPGQKHWHGATATTGMTHIAIQEHLDGKVVVWMEKVSDDQYRR